LPAGSSQTIQLASEEGSAIMRRIAYTIVGVLAVLILAIWFLSYRTTLHLTATNGGRLAFEFHADDGAFFIGTETSRLRNTSLLLVLLVVLIWPLVEAGLMLKRYLKQRAKPNIRTVKSKSAKTEPAETASSPAEAASPAPATQASSPAAAPKSPASKPQTSAATPAPASSGTPSQVKTPATASTDARPRPTAPSAVSRPASPTVTTAPATSPLPERK
jgi:cytoskeletal protein RodZ